MRRVGSRTGLLPGLRPRPSGRRRQCLRRSTRPDSRISRRLRLTPMGRASCRRLGRFDSCFPCCDAGVGRNVGSVKHRWSRVVMCRTGVNPLRCAVRASRKPRAAVNGRPSNACVRPMEPAGKAFCAFAILHRRKPVVCHPWRTQLGARDEPHAYKWHALCPSVRNLHTPYARVPNANLRPLVADSDLTTKRTPCFRTDVAACSGLRITAIRIPSFVNSRAAAAALQRSTAHAVVRQFFDCERAAALRSRNSLICVLVIRLL